MCLFGRPVHVTNRLSGANFPALIASWLELQPNRNLLCQLLPAQIHSIKPAPFYFSSRPLLDQPSPTASDGRVSLGAGVCSNRFGQLSANGAGYVRVIRPGPSIAIFRHCFWPAQRQAQSIDAQHLPIGIDHGSIDQASISISTRQKRLIGQRRARRPTDGTAGRLGQRRTRANTVSAKMRQGPAAAFSSGRLVRRSLKQNNCG